MKKFLLTLFLLIGMTSLSESINTIYLGQIDSLSPTLGLCKGTFTMVRESAATIPEATTGSVAGVEQGEDHVYVYVTSTCGFSQVLKSNLSSQVFTAFAGENCNNLGERLEVNKAGNILWVQTQAAGQPKIRRYSIPSLTEISSLTPTAMLALSLDLNEDETLMHLGDFSNPCFFREISATTLASTGRSYTCPAGNSFSFADFSRGGFFYNASNVFQTFASRVLFDSDAPSKINLVGGDTQALLVKISETTFTTSQTSTFDTPLTGNFLYTYNVADITTPTLSSALTDTVGTLANQFIDTANKKIYLVNQAAQSVIYRYRYDPATLPSITFEASLTLGVVGDQIGAGLRGVLDVPNQKLYLVANTGTATRIIRVGLCQ